MARRRYLGLMRWELALYGKTKDPDGNEFGLSPEGQDAAQKWLFQRLDGEPVQPFANLTVAEDDEELTDAQCAQAEQYLAQTRGVESSTGSV